jgi:hypothetical protein
VVAGRAYIQINTLASASTHAAVAELMPITMLRCCLSPLLPLPLPPPLPLVDIYVMKVFFIDQLP